MIFFILDLIRHTHMYIYKYTVIQYKIQKVAALCVCVYFFISNKQYDVCVWKHLGTRC